MSANSISNILYQSSSTNFAIYGTNLPTRRRMMIGLASSASPRLYSSILANSTTLCMKARVNVSPTVVSIVTDSDGIPIPDDATPYSRCTCPEHCPASPVEELQFDEPLPMPPPSPAHAPSHLIPPSPGLPPATAILASNSVASLHSLTPVPASPPNRDVGISVVPQNNSRS